jgi:hypothetical protein
MREKFELFRLSALLRQQVDAFGETGQNREGYLRSVFMDRWQFTFYGSEFHYVPDADQLRPDIILGRIGRVITSPENMPPDKGLADTIHEGWRAVAVLVDPTEHSDGQKVAVGVNDRVGNAGGLIAGVVNAINEKLATTEWDIEVEPIPDTDSFWQYARENEGEITSLTFEFVPPNMFGGTDDLSEELRDFRKDGAETVTLKLKTKETIKTNTKRTKEAVDYISKAGGKIRARSKKGPSFSSTKKTASTCISPPDQSGETKAQILARMARRILGYE